MYKFYRIINIVYLCVDDSYAIGSPPFLIIVIPVSIYLEYQEDLKKAR